MSTPELKERKKSRAGSIIFFLLAFLVIAAAVVALLQIRESREESVRAEAQAREAAVRTGPRVRVVTASRSPAQRRIELPGEARPYNQVTLYAKVSGYMKEINVDNGDRVREGQVLAVLVSPELDRQYDAAVADARNKESEAKRAWDVVSRGGVSREEAGSRDAAAKTAWANANALLAQKEYEIIRAPFAGVVTARFVDPGALIQNAGSSQTSAAPVVTVSQVDRLKIYAYASQQDAGFIRVGDKAQIWDVSQPAVKIEATLSRTSVALNMKTRTLLLEFDVANGKGEFVPGGFVQLSLTVRVPSYVEIPIGAMLIRSNKPFAALLTPENRVSLRTIEIAESDGKVVRLKSGVEDGEKVIVNGGQTLADGDPVQPMEANGKG